MARAANAFYHDDSGLGAALGLSLGQALFGDPEAAAKLALQRAQMDNYGANAEESRAHAGLYTRQGEGVGIQNDASRSLPDLIRSMVAPLQPAPASAPAGPGDPHVALPDAPPHVDPVAAFRVGLPALVAAMGQMQGDKIEPNKIVGGLSAMFGNDELARRGMAGEGVTPGKEFALTPERADAIAAQGYSADYRKGTDEARINHATDIPVANIKAATDRRGQDIASGDRRYAADSSAGASRDVADIRASGGRRRGGWTPRARDGGDNSDEAVDGKIAAMTQRLGVSAEQPIDRAHLPAVFDSIAATEGASGSPADRNNNPGNIRDGAFARSQPGYLGRGDGGFARFADKASGRQAGIALLGNYWDRGQRNVRDIVEGAPPSPKPGKAAQSKQVSKASLAMIDGELDAQARALGFKLTAGARTQIRNGSIKRFQKSGNPVQAVEDTLRVVQGNIARRNGQPAAQPSAQASSGQPPVNGARKAPDGKWYVQVGRNGDGSPKYARVDG